MRNENTSQFIKVVKSSTMNALNAEEEELGSVLDVIDDEILSCLTTLKDKKDEGRLQYPDPKGLSQQDGMKKVLQVAPGGDAVRIDSDVKEDVERQMIFESCLTTLVTSVDHSDESIRIDIKEDVEHQEIFESSLTSLNTNSRVGQGSNNITGRLLRFRRSGRAYLSRCYKSMRNNRIILGLSILLFGALLGAGIAISNHVAKNRQEELSDAALNFAIETGAWFSDQLDKAILPLFSMALFATELQIFHDLPSKIGPAGEPGSLPFLPPRVPDGPVTHRDVSGFCDDADLVAQFTKIASKIKHNAKMEGVLVNIQLAPQGVVCLLNPLNNTEDFEDGVFMDNTAVRGLDLFTDPKSKALAEASIIKAGEVTIAGPLTLQQCVGCHAAVEKAFIARLPIEVDDNEIAVDGVPYKRWGFATALINWENLVKRSGIYENVASGGYEFQLTRTDREYNTTSNSYNEKVVVIAESPHFDTQSKDHSVQTSLDTTNNEWEMTVVYDHSHTTKTWITVGAVLISLCISGLFYVVFVQRKERAAIVSRAFAQAAKVDTERNMTAYFAHELRNPLGAIDNALSSFPDDIPQEGKELVLGMQQCTGFMSSIMNNLLDVRKMEEGKMALHPQPFSLEALVSNIHKMLSPSVKKGVSFNFVCKTKGRDWVIGDMHRIQQVYTNVLTNAIKYTPSGSVTILVGWKGKNVQFECIDTGPGIPVEQQAVLFERFVQRGGAPGTGLGLAIVKEIVDLMGGSIRFISDPTVKPGTNCVVSLPLGTCKEPEEVETRSTGIKPIEEPLTLLIIDDIEMNRTMLKRRFQKGVAPNSVISEAATGEEALEICKTERFDVIVVDQYMEEAGGMMVGTDTVIAMRRLGLDSIIIGSSGNELEDEFVEAGADFVWSKPLPPNATVIKQLRGALRKRKALM